jgi:hypothetical protein
MTGIAWVVMVLEGGGRASSGDGGAQLRLWPHALVGIGATCRPPPWPPALIGQA